MPRALTSRTPRPEFSAGQSVSVHHVWDHAAGVALVRAAGGVVTDLDGSDWTPKSRSALVAAPGVHGELLEILNSRRRSAGTTDDPIDLAVRSHPVPGCRRRPGGQGRQLREPARCRRSRRTGRSLRRGGRRRADVPRRHRFVVGPGHHARGRHAAPPSRCSSR